MVLFFLFGGGEGRIKTHFLAGSCWVMVRLSGPFFFKGTGKTKTTLLEMHILNFFFRRSSMSLPIRPS